jgi:hypothetical protein
MKLKLLLEAYLDESMLDAKKKLKELQDTPYEMFKLSPELEKYLGKRKNNRRLPLPPIAVEILFAEKIATNSGIRSKKTAKTDKLMIFYGHSISGKFIPLNSGQFLSFLKKFKEGAELQVEIKERDKKRTSPQNRYLHQLFTILATELNKLGNNFTAQQIKDLCKCKFLKYTEVDKDGFFLGENIRHTSDLSRQELNELIEQIIAWGAELGIPLPFPGEQIKFKTL